MSHIGMPTGTPRSEKDRASISAGLKGKPKSSEHRAALSAAKKGKFSDAQRAANAAVHERLRSEGYSGVSGPMSQEHRDALSRARSGKFTEAQKQARDQITERWRVEGNPNTGTKRSDETRQRMSENALLRLPSRLVRYGVTQEEYAKQKQSGNSWCCFKKHFVPAGEVSRKTKNVCNACKSAADRVSDLKKNYGVTPEWYTDKLAQQGGGCAICGCTTTHTTRTKYLMIDHDHSTGETRGILCMPCNTAIERMEAVSDWESHARSYLNQYKCSTTIQTAI